MKKIIDNGRISFFDDQNNEIMYMDYLTDEFVWFFSDSNTIIVKDGEELFNFLKIIMEQQYIFNDSELLKSYKKNNKLVWYSDCYYNPDNEYSIKQVSYLNIEYVDNCFKVWCIKPLDDVIDRKQKSHCICFSPLGNGKYTKNIKTGLTLQDDFVNNVYHKLLQSTKIKKLTKSKMAK